MDKIPAFMKTITTGMVGYKLTLVEVARALEFDARISAKEGMKDNAYNARYYARAIRAVANGATWASALDIPEEDKTHE